MDGKSALTARWEWMEAGKTARSVAYDNPYRDLADVESEDKRYVYSGVGGVSRVTCEPVVAHRKGQAELFATIALSDREAPAPEMKKLLLAYAEALSDSSECVQKQGPQRSAGTRQGGRLPCTPTLFVRRTARAV
ncbi:hypothetical protein SNE510_38790 [Streptomyces sp. NE5-10]|uniref:hypothetical protein n=1 Tax=Streptomyces sp. NE5-10 TaxID=2759674 RepID=UPI001906733B|nr:hypothetical protein [Streptomyces sp. NE5-10]GHJ94360.1 hypothetical protein SNE510_38790 [Streptomyces sp. NE5-10]